MKRILRAGLACALLVVLAIPAAAQQTAGNVTGRVTDAQNAAVPGVTVTATNPQPALSAPTSPMWTASIG